MKRTILSISIILANLAFCLADPSDSPGLFDPQKIETLKRDLCDLLLQSLQKESGRKNVTLEIEAISNPESLVLRLPKFYTRETVFHLRISKIDSGYRVEGRCLCESEKTKIQQKIGNLIGDDPISWALETGILGYGIVTVPCADLYVEPLKERGDNLASQILQGTPVCLLETTQDKHFFRVVGQLDHYLGWLAAESFCIVTEERWADWMKMPKVFLGTFIDKPTMLYPGTTLGVQEEKVFVFDPQQGPKPIELDGRSHQAVSYLATAEEIAKTARRFLPNSDLGGITYLWGGTCVPQLDCSGFTQMVYRLNNVLLPRDADQQYQFGEVIPEQEMKAGDLIFFSKNGKRPTHIGIYLGERRYIHSSPSDPSGIKINDLDGTTEYEKYLRKIYFGSCRIVK